MIVYLYFFLPEESLRLLAEPSFIPDFHEEIFRPEAGVESGPKQGLCATVQLAWALVLRSCSQWPELVGATEILEDDEGVLDLAVDGNVFAFLRRSVIGAANFHQGVCL